MPPTGPGPLRLAVVGCGAVTERYHLPALLSSPDISVAVLVDPDQERALALARRAGGAPVVARHDDLPVPVDLALVAVPNAHHASVAADLLRAGVHVLVEKPMARTVAECDRMVAAAAGSGRILAVGHDFRHYPVAHYARELFHSNLLGAVRAVDVRQSTGLGWPAVSATVLSREAGGGVLIDFGVHLLDLLLWWFGDLRVLEYRDDAAGGVESDCTCRMELTGGVEVRMELSRTRALRDTMLVECERGTVELGVFDPAVVRLSAPGLRPIDASVPDPEFARAPMRAVFSRQLDDVVTAIRENREPLVPGWQGRRAVALVEACYATRRPLAYPWDVPAAARAMPQP